MTDLFSGQETPLADRMRPRTLAEFIGQRHLLGEGRLLRRAIEADRLTSSIFFGPPGCGKTTLASIIANSTKSAFVQLNAVTSGVADVRKVIADAQERRAYGQSTYLLLDECHRWSKAQSDSILPAIERGYHPLYRLNDGKPDGVHDARYCQPMPRIPVRAADGTGRADRHAPRHRRPGARLWADENHRR